MKIDCIIMALDIYNVVTTPSTTSRFIKDPDNRQTGLKSRQFSLCKHNHHCLPTFRHYKLLKFWSLAFVIFFFSCYLTHTPRVIISVTVKRRMRFSVMFFLPVQLQVYQSRKLMLHFGFIVSELFSRNILYRVGKSTRKSFQK